MTFLRALTWSVLVGFFTLSAPAAAWAQEDVDDDLDEILGTGPSSPTSTVADERREAEREAEQGTDPTDVVLPDAKKHLIKTLQKKNFLKIKRFEFMPFVGLVTNDPFVNRILFGGGLGYHITEVFQFEIQGSYAPILGVDGVGDYKPVTNQLTCQGKADDSNCNSVAPEISRQIWHMVGQFNWSPFYGKIAARRSTIAFDLYASLGAGVVGTQDDLKLLGVGPSDTDAFATEFQAHPAISLGGGLRVNFSKTVGLRLEVRTISYIGVLRSTQLELKNNLTMLLGASILFGRRVQ